MLGNLLIQRGETTAAIECYQRALSHQPKLALAHHNLATAYRKCGRVDEAIQHYRIAHTIAPDETNATNDLAGLLIRAGAIGEAMDLLRRIVQIDPNDGQTHNNLGHALRACGLVEQAIASYGRARELKPHDVEVHSNLLYAENFLPQFTSKALLASHREWDQQHAATLKQHWRPHQVTRDPERELRLGFVSPDFGPHPVGFLTVGFLEALQSHRCTTICYSNRTNNEDALTQRIAKAATTWRQVAPMSDEALSEQIRSDEVDILFDLAGHTAGHRLLVFARKPAPIQSSWIGYVGTTGMEAMDYLVADRYIVPEEAEDSYQERILLLPESRLCFTPMSEAPQVGSLPAESNGHVTFGSFNNPAKVTPDVLAKWAEILERAPKTRLVLKYRGYGDPALTQRIEQFFADRKLDLTRIDLRDASSHAHMMGEYNQVDVALDPFPFSGGATSCDALWMGVPVVTCPMETLASRQTLGILSSIGMTETVARDENHYVDLAVALAEDLSRLADLRRGLRTRMACSPLCDADAFAATFMKSIREVWRNWCERIEPD